MADILKEQRNPTFTTFKKMASYRVNKPFKDPTYQNKNPKRIENSRLSNRRKKPDRSSNYNIYSKKDEKASKDVETKPESDLDLELESFIYIIKNFDLDDSKSSCFISFLNSKNSVENSETKSGYLAIFNKSKKLLKQSSNRSNLLLYNIDITNYIVNDKKQFKNDYTFNKSQLKTLKIGGGLVISKGNGTAVFIVLSYMNLLKYCEVIFENVLYFLDINVNLFNDLKYYKSKGYLEKNRLYISQRKIITRLNIVKTGFFIPLKGHKNSNAFANFCYNFYKDDFYIFILAKPLKARPNKSNASKKVIPKSNLYKSKDCQQFEISKKINIGNNGFKDLNFWESTKERLCMPKDKPCEPVESQEVTIGLEQAFINGLNPETSRRTARERLRMPAEPRNIEETNDTHRNPKDYNALL